MNYKRFLILCCVFIASLLPPSSHACSTICLDKDDELVVGKNFDWVTEDGLIIANKRNVSKTAHLNSDWVGEQPASWTSKYGSVTFNPWGREFPFSGMNEVGLVVSAMGLSSIIYPTPDQRPAISSTQWIQYQLDNSATVAQVIASDLELRISNSDTPLHFFVCDSTGTCATIEFIDGKLVYHTQETMPVKALVNTTYEKAIDYWEKDKIPPFDPGKNIKRFITAAQMLEDYDPATSGPAVDYTFNILSDMEWSFSIVKTYWSIAYDIPNHRINFHTFTNRSIRYFDVNSFDFSCLTPVRVLNIQEDLSGDVSEDFIDYTYELNRSLIEKTLDLESYPEFTEEAREAYASYPETTECTGACKLDIKHKKIKSNKLSKSRKRVLHITGDEDFDIFGQIDLGPITWQKKSFNTKKNSLKIRVRVPAGLEPGIIPVSVGNCYGEIEIL